jgi:hypothetical protein
VSAWNGVLSLERTPNHRFDTPLAQLPERFEQPGPAHPVGEREPLVSPRTPGLARDTGDRADHPRSVRRRARARAGKYTLVALAAAVLTLGAAVTIVPILHSTGGQDATAASAALDAATNPVGATRPAALPSPVTSGVGPESAVSKCMDRFTGKTTAEQGPQPGRKVLSGPIYSAAGCRLPKS